MTQPKPDIGKALALTPEQLDQAAAVTSLDQAAADALWRSAAPPKLTELLNATRDDSAN